MIEKVGKNEARGLEERMVLFILKNIQQLLQLYLQIFVIIYSEFLSSQRWRVCTRYKEIIGGCNKDIENDFYSNTSPNKDLEESKFYSISVQIWI